MSNEGKSHTFDGRVGAGKNVRVSGSPKDRVQRMCGDETSKVRAHDKHPMQAGKSNHA